MTGQQWRGAGTWPWILFTLLCLLEATRWLVPVEEFEKKGVPALAIAALLAAGLSWALVFRKEPRAGTQGGWSSRPGMVRAGVGGALLLAGIGLPRWFPTPGLTAGAWTLALALSPVVIAVAEPALGHEPREGLTGRLWPGLAAVAGLLLLLPEPSVPGLRSWVLLGSLPLLTGLGAVLLAGTEGPPVWTRSAGLTGACVAALLGTLVENAHVQPHLAASASMWEVAVQGLSLFLSTSLVIAWGAFRWSAVFAVVPLLIALQGVVLLRPQLEARALMGMGLLLVGSVFLLMDGTVAGNA